MDGNTIRKAEGKARLGETLSEWKCCREIYAAPGRTMNLRECLNICTPTEAVWESYRINWELWSHPRAARTLVTLSPGWPCHLCCRELFSRVEPSDLGHSFSCRALGTTKHKCLVVFCYALFYSVPFCPISFYFISWAHHELNNNANICLKCQQSLKDI